MNLTLEEKIGQLIMPRLDLPSSDLSWAERLIREFHIGGFILFGGEVDTIGETLNYLQRISKHPLLFSADLERGLGQQVRGATSFPYAMGLAEAHSSMASAIPTSATITAAESRAVGIHLNFAPVVDINNNPDNPIINIRAFGHDLNRVVQCSTEYIRALQENRMLATAKHFPGHGSSKTDSHKGFVDVTDTWQRDEITPYAELIRRNLVDMVMTAHIFNAKLDPAVPATLSPKIMAGILRDSLKYNGVIISDDMQMGAIADHYGLENALEQAINAGVDIVCFGNNLSYDPAIITKVHTIIKRLVAEKKVSSERIDESYRRVLRLKQKIR
ncbi:glycoside hydrolase family 3 [bacterium]|nr:glycoside hydrolase family 3 [bacterium]